MLIFSENLSEEELTKKVKDFANNLDIDDVGIADVENDVFLVASPDYQPKNVLQGAKSVIVLLCRLPKGPFLAPSHKKQSLHRAHHSIMKHLDILAARLAGFIESFGYYALTIPAYNPITINKTNPMGLISLKLAGLAAGLGKIAKSELLMHPKYGTLVRLSAVVTTAKLLPDPMSLKDVCTDCGLCIENCPAKAFDKKGNYLPNKCSRKSMEHGNFVLHKFTPEYLKNIEMIINTTLLEYSISCSVCQEICPINKIPKIKSKTIENK